MSNTNKFTIGKGIRLYREDGKEFLDAESGTFNLSLGHSHPAVVQAVAEQLGKVVHLSSSNVQPYVEELQAELLSLLPTDSPINDGWFRDITGSSANECAIKNAQNFTGKSDVVSMWLGHYGQSNYILGFSGNSFRRESLKGTRNDHSIKVAPPYCYRCPFNAKFPTCGLMCVEKINDQLEYGGNGDTACLIIEPVFGNGGNIVPPPGYFEALRKLCDEQGILLICDEVQTGIGRTGFGFGSEALRAQPHMMTLAKGLSGIGLPIGAVLMESRLKVLAPFQHSFTSGNYLLGIVAALATLREIKRPGFLEGVRHKGALLGELLDGLAEKHACIGDVRGLGYMWGIEIVGKDNDMDVDLTNSIIQTAYDEQRLILRSSRNEKGNVIKVRPALITSEEDLEEICLRLDRAISVVTGFAPHAKT